MPPAKAASKSTGAPGAKMLITAASLAATLGGWALLSADGARPVAQPAMPPTAAPQVEVTTLSIKLAPLPTLVPLAPQSRIVTVNNPSAAAPARATQPAAPTDPVAAAAPAVLALRVVSAPPQPDRSGPSASRSSSSAPAPVANTRSSR